MTTATHNELMTLAKLAADYLTKLNGESEYFEVETENFTACINYEAEIGEDKGDYWTAPSWWVKSETATVKAVFTEDGQDKEAAEFLQKMLN